jgi:hypothetical protein
MDNMFMAGWFILNIVKLIMSCYSKYSDVDYKLLSVKNLYVEMSTPYAKSFFIFSGVLS